MQGIDLVSVKDLLEYKSMKMTLRYSHLSHVLLYQWMSCTHLKIVFGIIQKQFYPSKVLGAFQSVDNCLPDCVVLAGNQDLVFWKAKNQTGFSISWCCSTLSTLSVLLTILMAERNFQRVGAMTIQSSSCLRYVVGCLCRSWFIF